MCLIAFAWRGHPRYSLALIANRDEFHERPSAAAHFHADAREVYGGRDLDKGGGWLELSTRRRLAAVTNVRAGRSPEVAPRSRGELVNDFVRSSNSKWPAGLPNTAGEFGRFNLLAWTGDALRFASNYPQFQSQSVAPGLHRLSNATFDADWPKARRAEDGLRDWLEGSDAAADEPDLAALFATLADTRQADDAELPDTGVGLELERMLSSPFIVGERYGTRCSSVVLIEDNGVLFCERRFGANGLFLGESRQRLAWQD